jgi:hypothetical protein
MRSLGDGQERLAIVIEMVIATDGTVTASDIYREAVLNRAKLAYNGVAAWLESRRRRHLSHAREHHNTEAIERLLSGGTHNGRLWPSAAVRDVRSKRPLGKSGSRWEWRLTSEVANSHYRPVADRRRRRQNCP